MHTKENPSEERIGSVLTSLNGELQKEQKARIEDIDGCIFYLDGENKPIPLYNNGIRPENPSLSVYESFEPLAAEFISSLRSSVKTPEQARQAAIVIKRWGLNPDLVKLIDFEDR